MLQVGIIIRLLAAEQVPTLVILLEQIGMDDIYARRAREGLVDDLLALLIDNGLEEGHQILGSLEVDIAIKVDDGVGIGDGQVILVLQLLDDRLQVLELGFADKLIEQEDHALDECQLGRIEFVLGYREARCAISIDASMPCTLVGLGEDILAIGVTDTLEVAHQGGARSLTACHKVLKGIVMALVSKAFVEYLKAAELFFVSSHGIEICAKNSHKNRAIAYCGASKGD